MSAVCGDTRKHSHYHKDVKHLDSIDVYRVLQLFGVTDPCIQHSVKKLLCAGQRGSKPIWKDVQEAIDSLTRWQQMLKEDAASFVDPLDIEISDADDRLEREYNRIMDDRVEIIRPTLNELLRTEQDEPASAIDDYSERMQAIGQNGNGGEHYGAPDWSKAPYNSVAYIDWTGSSAGFESAFYSDGGDRFYRLDGWTPTSQYVLKRDDGSMDIDYPYFMRPVN